MRVKANEREKVYFKPANKDRRGGVKEKVILLQVAVAGGEHRSRTMCCGRLKDFKLFKIAVSGHDEPVIEDIGEVVFVMITRERKLFSNKSIGCSERFQEAVFGGLDCQNYQGDPIIIIF